MLAYRICACISFGRLFFISETFYKHLSVFEVSTDKHSKTRIKDEMAQNLSNYSITVKCTLFTLPQLKEIIKVWKFDFF